METTITLKFDIETMRRHWSLLAVIYRDGKYSSLAQHLHPLAEEYEEWLANAGIDDRPIMENWHDIDLRFSNEDDALHFKLRWL